VYSIIKQNQKWKFIHQTPNQIQIQVTPRIPSLTIPSPSNLLLCLEFIWLKYIVLRNKIIFWTAISDLIRFMLTHLRLPIFFRIQNGERLKEWALLLQREAPYRDSRIAVGFFIIPFRDKLAQDSQITGL
jgi:hypothetical protein